MEKKSPSCTPSRRAASNAAGGRARAPLGSGGEGRGGRGRGGRGMERARRDGSALEHRRAGLRLGGEREYRDGPSYPGDGEGGARRGHMHAPTLGNKSALICVSLPNFLLRNTRGASRTTSDQAAPGTSPSNVTSIGTVERRCTSCVTCSIRLRSSSRCGSSASLKARYRPGIRSRHDSSCETCHSSCGPPASGLAITYLGLPPVTGGRPIRFPTTTSAVAGLARSSSPSRTPGRWKRTAPSLS